MLIAMAAVLVTWLALSLLLAGLGLSVQRAFGVRKVDTDGVLLSVLVGYAAVIAFAQLWNYLLPLRGAALAIVVAAGVIGLAWNAPRLWPWARGAIARRPRLAAVMVLALVWVANLALGPGDAHDSGLYHYGLIRWAHEYPVVPGVGNLSYALALNNASLLVAAVLDNGPWQGRVEHIANGLLLAVLVAHALIGAARLLRPGGSPAAADVFRCVLIVPAVMLMFSREVCSPTTDLPQAVLTWAVVQIAIGVLAARGCAPFEQGPRVVSAGVLGAAAVCVKLSAVVFAPLVCLLAGGWWLRRDRPSPALRARTIGWAASVVLVLVVPWMGRNVVMSGYPLYPSTAISVPVSWRSSKAAVDNLVGVIRDHSRGRLPLWIHDRLKGSPLGWYAPLMKPPFDDYRDIQGLEWVRPWLFSLPASSLVEVVVPVTLAAVIWMLVGLRRLRGGGRAGGAGGAGGAGSAESRSGATPGVATVGPEVWLLVPVAAGIVFWLFASPEPRYGYAVMWTLAGVSAAAAFPVLAPRSGREGPMLLSVVAVLSLVAVAYRAAVIEIHLHDRPWRQIPFRGPGTDHGFHPLPFDGPYEPIVTATGLRLFVPGGDATRCWRGPLPCAGDWPPLDPTLRLRRPSDLGAGFQIDRPDR